MPEEAYNLLVWFNAVSEPRSGFRIAFNMFDTDGNQRVDKKEFLVVCKITILINYNFQ